LEDRFVDEIEYNGIFEDVTFIVDVTECPIAKPCDFEEERMFWSGKAHTTTLKYQSNHTNNHFH
jgi:hypothetical protein